MKVTKERIKKAITNNRGGLDGATDDQLGILWRSLPDKTKEKYLQTLCERKSDAVSTGPKKKK